MKKYKDFIFAVLNPSFWNMHMDYNKEWDDIVEYFIENNKPVKLYGSYIVSICGVKVWVENYPYAYGHPYDPHIKVRPSRRNIKRMKKYIDQKLVESIKHD